MRINGNKALSLLRSPEGAPRPSGIYADAEPERPEWLRHIGLLNDYVRIPYANGSSFATQFFYREFVKRGHQVTVVGPDDPEATEADLPRHHVCLPSLPLRNHPGVRLPLPTRKGLAEVASRRFDVLLGQSCSELVDLGVWLRWTQHVPFLVVNTVHFASAYNVLLPDALAENELVNGFCQERLIPWLERHTASVYNQTDGLIVLSRGLESFWRERGVTVPIHVIPRNVEPRIFDNGHAADPFPAHFKKGARLLVVCRHTREKGVSRLLSIFAREVAPHLPDATLTLVGDGPDYDSFRLEAEQLGVADRTFFPGEYPVTQIPNWYRNADLFVYTSLSETYGQVVSEAMWCGLPVVALADDMGVSHQVENRHNGVLIPPGPDTERADRRFGAEVIRLLRDPAMLRVYAQRARKEVGERAHPERCIRSYYRAFDEAYHHCQASIGERISRPLNPMSTILRWAWVQSLALGLGCLRPPATVNRHGRKQPGWDALEQEPIGAAGEHRIRGGDLVELSERLKTNQPPAGVA